MPQGGLVLPPGVDCGRGGGGGVDRLGAVGGVGVGVDVGGGSGVGLGTGSHVPHALTPSAAPVTRTPPSGFLTYAYPKDKIINM